ncbi:MAG: alpha/beta fold hydrolase [Chloroflexaceae bacterium]|nr:alpha/beta fold hydrolase [Chloroflexaceae bacterium]
MNASEGEKSVTFVLVHGGWHGGWCWKKLTPLVQATGHTVLTPTLTGMGERAHLLNPEIDLDLHIQDIVAVLEYEDLREVVLVGHSYGGMVIAGVAERATERLAHLVYLDAFLPENGKALQDYAFLPPTRDDDGWRVLPYTGSPGMFGVTDGRGSGLDGTAHRRSTHQDIYTTAAPFRRFSSDVATDIYSV